MNFGLNPRRRWRGARRRLLNSRRRRRSGHLLSLEVERESDSQILLQLLLLFEIRHRRQAAVKGLRRCGCCRGHKVLLRRHRIAYSGCGRWSRTASRSRGNEAGEKRSRIVEQRLSGSVVVEESGIVVTCRRQNGRRGRQCGSVETAVVVVGGVAHRRGHHLTNKRHLGRRDVARRRRSKWGEIYK